MHWFREIAEYEQQVETNASAGDLALCLARLADRVPDRINDFRRLVHVMPGLELILRSQQREVRDLFQL
jgi:hypothetical protein